MYGFKTARGLKHHLLDGAYVNEIKAASPNPVDTNVSHQEHAQFPVAFSLFTQQAGQ